MENKSDMATKIYYDGECPFCTHYVKLLRLRDSVGRVELTNLREDTALRAELSQNGFDLDQGMVIEMNGRRLGGADATHALALMSTPSGAFNRLNKLMFSVPLVSSVLYPILRTGRWLTLFAMGRKSIAETDHDVSSHQILFSFFFGLFSLFHVFNYAFEYGRFPPQYDVIAIFVAALAVLLRPESARALSLLMLASLISTVLQAPVQSNHTMLRTVVLIGYWLSFGYTCIRARPASQIFENVVLAGRWSLLVMYFFGIFHKINTDFLNPATSCAVRLWQDMPLPLSAVQGSFVDYATIYGTYVVEGTIMLCLMLPRTRYLGMVCGIFFHLLLGLSDYAAYIAFTTLSISLHVLFLSGAQSERILGSPEMAMIHTKMQKPLYKLVFLILLTGGGLAMYLHAFSLSNLYLLPFVVPLCYLIIRYGHERHAVARRYPRPAIVIGAVAAGLYFLNGISPYFGLKTAQSINMFANLRLEAGISNHLVFSNPPGPFSYLEDVAVITDSGGSTFLRYYQNRDFGIVYYDLLGYLADHPTQTVSFEMTGHAFDSVSAANVENDIKEMLHPSWVRKWFHFQPVQLDRPEACSL